MSSVSSNTRSKTAKMDIAGKQNKLSIQFVESVDNIDTLRASIETAYGESEELNDIFNGFISRIYNAMISMRLLPDELGRDTIKKKWIAVCDTIKNRVASLETASPNTDKYDSIILILEMFVIFYDKLMQFLLDHEKEDAAGGVDLHAQCQEEKNNMEATLAELQTQLEQAQHATQQAEEAKAEAEEAKAEAERREQSAKDSTENEKRRTEQAQQEADVAKQRANLAQQEALRRTEQAQQEANDAKQRAELAERRAEESQHEADAAKQRAEEQILLVNQRVELAEQDAASAKQYAEEQKNLAQQEQARKSELEATVQQKTEENVHEKQKEMALEAKLTDMKTENENLKIDLKNEKEKAEHEKITRAQLQNQNLNCSQEKKTLEETIIAKDAKIEEYITELQTVKQQLDTLDGSNATAELNKAMSKLQRIKGELMQYTDDDRRKRYISTIKNNTLIDKNKIENVLDTFYLVSRRFITMFNRIDSIFNILDGVQKPLTFSNNDIKIIDELRKDIKQQWQKQKAILDNIYNIMNTLSGNESVTSTITQVNDIQNMVHFLDVLHPVFESFVRLTSAINGIYATIGASDAPFGTINNGEIIRGYIDFIKTHITNTEATAMQTNQNLIILANEIQTLYLKYVEQIYQLVNLIQTAPDYTYMISNNMELVKICMNLFNDISKLAHITHPDDEYVLISDDVIKSLYVYFDGLYTHVSALAENDEKFKQIVTIFESPDDTMGAAIATNEFAEKFAKKILRIGHTTNTLDAFRYFLNTVNHVFSFYTHAKQKKGHRTLSDVYQLATLSRGENEFIHFQISDTLSENERIYLYTESAENVVDKLKEIANSHDKFTKFKEYVERISGNNNILRDIVTKTTHPDGFIYWIKQNLENPNSVATNNYCLYVYEYFEQLDKEADIFKLRQGETEEEYTGRLRAHIISNTGENQMEIIQIPEEVARLGSFLSNEAVIGYTETNYVHKLAREYDQNLANRHKGIQLVQEYLKYVGHDLVKKQNDEIKKQQDMTTDEMNKARRKRHDTDATIEEESSKVINKYVTERFDNVFDVAMVNVQNGNNSSNNMYELLKYLERIQDTYKNPASDPDADPVVAEMTRVLADVAENLWGAAYRSLVNDEFTTSLWNGKLHKRVFMKSNPDPFDYARDLIAVCMLDQLKAARYPIFASDDDVKNGFNHDEWNPTFEKVSSWSTQNWNSLRGLLRVNTFDENTHGSLARGNYERTGYITPGCQENGYILGNVLDGPAIDSPYNVAYTFIDPSTMSDVCNQADKLLCDVFNPRIKWSDDKNPFLMEITDLCRCANLVRQLVIVRFPYINRDQTELFRFGCAYIAKLYVNTYSNEDSIDDQMERFDELLGGTLDHISTDQPTGTDNVVFDADNARIRAENNRLRAENNRLREENEQKDIEIARLQSQLQFKSMTLSNPEEEEELNRSYMPDVDNTNSSPGKRNAATGDDIYDNISRLIKDIPENCDQAKEKLRDALAQNTELMMEIKYLKLQNVQDKRNFETEKKLYKMEAFTEKNGINNIGIELNETIAKLKTEKSELERKNTSLMRIIENKATASVNLTSQPCDPNDYSHMTSELKSTMEMFTEQILQFEANIVTEIRETRRFISTRGLDVIFNNLANKIEMASLDMGQKFIQMNIDIGKIPRPKLKYQEDWQTRCEPPGTMVYQGSPSNLSVFYCYFSNHLITSIEKVFAYSRSREIPGICCHRHLNEIRDAQIFRISKINWSLDDDQKLYYVTIRNGY